MLNGLFPEPPPAFESVIDGKSDTCRLRKRENNADMLPPIPPRRHESIAVVPLRYAVELDFDEKSRPSLSGELEANIVNLLSTTLGFRI
ncbi:hypothetical protein CEXT_298711 [Caerostris extrusa]|uniref:Uncharacterized protein n=1 Tax=Caerostris extrusa TaxID=172846 RepID=A0AAV4XXI7_CAEEX|nr:hypothetical protein CEXT_298711 [Caerostris extrusa]